MSDTTWFDMRGTMLTPALVIAFNAYKAWGYKSTPDRLTFAWHKLAGSDFVPFVTPIDSIEAKSIVEKWCKEVASYPKMPDYFEGESERSWRIYCDNWGHVGGNAYAFAAVEPYWALYGK